MADEFAASGEGSEGCVLIVDDDPLLLAILEEQLDSLGLRDVRRCERADEALQQLSDGLRPHTLITDLAMPEMDGPRFLHALAELADFKARIVLVSGARADILRSSEQLGLALGLHMVGSLSKPVALADLQELLARDDAWQATRPAPLALELVEPALLRAALDRHEIRPWYQPKLDARGLQMVGVEALARWLPPGGRPISPAQFVPVVEAQGWGWDLFIVMLEQVLADQRRWLEHGWRLKAAVNLTMDCTHRLDLPDQIARRAAAQGVPLDLLILEVTETGLMGDRSAALETLNRLSLMGVGLSIDDFGTGYSSIAKLSDLPFTELKIDASFVRRLGRDAKAERILHTMVGLGQSLEMSVVAEGVEHYAQLQALAPYEAMLVQGFLLARPMPASALEAWVLHWRPGLRDRSALRGGHRMQRPLGVLLYAVQGDRLAALNAQLRTLCPDCLVNVATTPQQAAEAAQEGGLDLLLVQAAPLIEADLLRLRDLAPAATLVMLGQPTAPVAVTLQQLRGVVAAQGLEQGLWQRLRAELDEPAHGGLA